jgi:hypothetical protein
MALVLPFADGRWRLKLGLAALDLDEWLWPDGEFAATLARKRALLTEHHGEVFAALPEGEAGGREVLAAFADYLPQRFADLYRRTGRSLVVVPTDETWDLEESGLAPLDLAGRLVQEDLCLMAPGAQGYRLVAGSVCFPSRWSLCEKLGLPLVGIHAPVPGYDVSLAGPVDRFFVRFRSDTPQWRANWAVTDTPELFLPPSTAAQPQADIDGTNAGERLWLRIERQTLRRLSVTRCVLFTIRTIVLPLAALDREARTALAAVITQLPEATARYKSIAPYRTALLAYLR